MNIEPMLKTGIEHGGNAVWINIGVVPQADREKAVTPARDCCLLAGICAAPKGKVLN